MKDITIEKMISDLREQEGIEDSDRVWMFIQLCDDKPIMGAMQHHATMVKMGLVPPDNVIFPFAYGVLKLAKPHLFPEEPG